MPTKVEKVRSIKTIKFISFDKLLWGKRNKNSSESIFKIYWKCWSVIAQLLTSRIWNG